MKPLLPILLADLAEERRLIRLVVAHLNEQAWAHRSSTSRTIRDQIAHLAYYDDVAVVAIADPDEFAKIEKDARVDPAAFERAHLRSVPASGQATLIAWERAAATFDLVARCAPAAARIPWFGSDVTVLDLVADRLTETQACGQDILDALGTLGLPTDRLRHGTTLAGQGADGCRAKSATPAGRGGPH